MQTSAWTTPDWCKMPPTDTNAGAVTHTCHRQHQIRPELDPVALFLRGRICVSECSQSSVEGGLGAIKPKRLGEDELLRMYESRHRLYNPTTQFAPLPRMCREALQGRFAESRWTPVFRPKSAWAVCCLSPQQTGWQQFQSPPRKNKAGDCVQLQNWAAEQRTKCCCGVGISYCLITPKRSGGSICSFLQTCSSIVYSMNTFVCVIR